MPSVLSCHQPLSQPNTTTNLNKHKQKNTFKCNKNPKRQTLNQETKSLIFFQRKRHALHPINPPLFSHLFETVNIQQHAYGNSESLKFEALMEARLPLSATQMAPKAASSYSKTSGIRAPLTVDESDFECSVSSKSRRDSSSGSYYSGSEVESEDFESGEDELETVSERAHLVEQDEGILEETHLIKEFAVSEASVVELDGEMVEGSSSNEHGFYRPSVRSLDGEFGRESGNVSGNAAFRPFVRIPDERIYGGNSDVDDSDDLRSYVSESGDELVEHESYVVHDGDSRPLVAVRDEEVRERGQIAVVDVKIPLVQKLHVPIAQISGDSDDDSQGSGVLDDEGFSGIVRVPSIEVLRRISSAAKVRMLEGDEGDDSESQNEDIMGVEFVKDLVINNAVLGTSDEKEHIGVENSIDCVISADMIQYNAPAINKDTTGNSLVVNEELNTLSESGQDGDFMHLDEKIQEIDVMDDQKKFEGLVDHREPTDLADGAVFPDSIADVASGAEPGLMCGSIKLMEPEVNELGSSSNFGASSLDDEDTKSSNTGLEGNLVFDHYNEREKLERKSEQEIDLIVESLSCNAAREISSVNQCVDIKEVPVEGCPEFPDLPEFLKEKTQVYMSDRLLKDASLIGVINARQSGFEGHILQQETRKEAENTDLLPGEEEDSTFHSDTKEVEAEMNRVPDSTFSSGQILLDDLQETDGQIVADFDEEVDADGGISDRRQIMDPAALAAFFEVVRGAVSDESVVKHIPIDGIENFSLESNSNDLGSLHSARPIAAATNSNDLMPPSVSGELKEALSEREKKKIEKIQQIRVKYLRLLHRLGCSPEDSVASKVLYQLTLAESSYSQACHLDSALKAAMELEAQKKDDLDFSLCILVIGKTGVGKSATINSIFGERKAIIDAFEPATTHAKEIVGTIDGVKLKVFDTPGLRTSLKDQAINRKILSSIKRLMQKSPPDVILYVDRLDIQTSNVNDLPLLKLVTSYLGSSIWRKSIVAFTHGTSIPPDGPNGYPLSYEVFIAQQSRLIRQLISHSAGELLLMNPGSMIPVSLVENHLFADKNKHGETLLHNGESWRSELLLLSCSVKTLSESSVVTLQNGLDHKKLFGLQIRWPALSYFLSSFLQSNVHPELSTDQSGESVVSDVEPFYSSDSDQEEDIMYDNLPPFKPLNKSQIAKLSRDQRKAYFEEYDYRIKLLQKKQFREEMRQLRNSRKLKSGAVDETHMDKETGAPQTVAVPLPDMALPPSFDGENPSFRYRLLEASSWLLTRPVLGSHRWDHDCGYDGVLIEDKIDIANFFPAEISVQVTKDKKEFTIQFHSSVSAKHGDKGSTMAGLDILTFGKKLGYTLKGETKIKNFRKNETAAGVSITFLGENVVSGLKVEDHITVGKQLILVGNAGVVQSQDDAAYGVNLNLCRRDEDYPISQDQTSLGLSIMRHRSDLVCGCNLQSEFSVSRNSKLNITMALNNKLSGQISMKMSCADQLQIAALALVPIARVLLKKIFRRSTEDYST